MRHPKYLKTIGLAEKMPLKCSQIKEFQYFQSKNLIFSKSKCAIPDFVAREGGWCETPYFTWSTPPRGIVELPSLLGSSRCLSFMRAVREVAGFGGDAPFEIRPPSFLPRKPASAVSEAD